MDNAGKELALAGGAFVIAGCFSENNKNLLIGFPEKLMRFGSILFSLPIVTFGILHLLYAKDVSNLVRPGYPTLYSGLIWPVLDCWARASRLFLKSGPD